MALIYNICCNLWRKRAEITTYETRTGQTVGQQGADKERKRQRLQSVDFKRRAHAGLERLIQIPGMNSAS